MRPLRLEVAGFAAFRELVEVDFSDADYFAFVGPTGSGKSTLIDAMTFALYGSIPRLDMRSVAPVITQGSAEARVRFDFAIGEREYTAVRVVRRQGDGASTKEARLEQAGDVLAGDADGLTAEVERLLGLGFEEFTRCVVLPQGDFARFMHDKPAARQDLLVRLLDLDVYGRMGQRANMRAVEADARAKSERQRLEDLSYATDDALKTVRAQVETLRALQARIDDEEPKLASLRDVLASAQEQATASERAVGVLEKVAMPRDVPTLAQRVAEAAAAGKRAEESVSEAEETLKAADAACADLPARPTVETALTGHKQLAVMEKDRRAAEKAAASVEKTKSKLEKQTEDAEKAADEAQHAFEAARVQHRAQDLARKLVAGDPCPVCGQVVHDLPAVNVPTDLAASEKKAKTAVTKLKAANDDLAAADKEMAVAVGDVKRLTKETSMLSKALSEHADATTLEKQLTAIVAAEKSLDAARRGADAARAAARKARAAVEEATRLSAGARKTLDGVRDRLAEYSPPPLSRDDLAADWTALVEWARAETARRRTAITEATASAQAARKESDSIVEAQRAACVAAGIDDVTNPRDDCLKEIERASARATQIELALESTKEIQEMVRALDEQSVVARELGKHLKANAFERWVLRQALTTLVDGATSILLELSGGQYSLTLDKQYNFAVVDHRNADAVRSARTLSGGETFLASLALALAMSDRIAQLSANTAVRLESIFLDEGFGTLDPETLETVATAIEHLGRTSRVVGIVTHVRDLAERIPIRYEVRKGVSTSTVEKVFA